MCKRHIPGFVHIDIDGLQCEVHRFVHNSSEKMGPTTFLVFPAYSLKLDKLKTEIP